MSIYEVLEWGEPVGGGVTEARFCTLEGVAKQDTPEFPYVVANEFVCSRLALVLGLPVPTGAMVPTESGVAYVSLRFGPKNEKLPPVIVEQFVKDNPNLAAGIVAFDVWIGNDDRHPGNLAYVRGLAGPFLFDHSHALLKTDAAHLLRDLDNPRIGGCLVPQVDDVGYFFEWIDRIQRVSPNVVRAFVRQAQDAGALGAEDAKAVVGFLIYRQPRMGQLLNSARSRFKEAVKWGLA